MESLGFIFGLMGMSFGFTAFVFAVISMSKLAKLEKIIEEQGLVGPK